MVGKIVLVVGILGLLLGFAVTGISLALPILTDGRTSWEEAMLGIIPGILVLFVSLIMAIIGLVLVLKGRKQSWTAEIYSYEK